MMTDPRRAEPGPSQPDRTERIRVVVARDFDALLRSIGLLVRSCHRLSSPGEVAERAAEVLNEAVQIALANADRYDPNRSALAWIRGIAIRVLMGQRRDEARERGRIARQTDLGERWNLLLQVTDRREDSLGDRLEVQEALARLDPASRDVIECRFFRGLDGWELAEAIGAPSPGAARVRVVRAKQKLEPLLSPTEPEVRP